MSASTHPETVSTESPLLWPALALLVIAVACFTYYWDGHRYEFPYSTAHGPLLWPPPPGTLVQPGGEAYLRIETAYSLKLADGVPLTVPFSFQMERELVAFIQDRIKPVSKTTWFDFDGLLFSTNEATLQPSSQRQLHDIAAILMSYPAVHARIGGYTDTTGDATANQQLSQERAANVMNELVKLGVPASHLDAKGYGADHPVGDNSTVEGRDKNRRIALRVTQK